MKKKGGWVEWDKNKMQDLWLLYKKIKGLARSRKDRRKWCEERKVDDFFPKKKKKKEKIEAQ